jgi:hypothetical protein
MGLRARTLLLASAAAIGFVGAAHAAPTTIRADLDARVVSNASTPSAVENFSTNNLAGAQTNTPTAFSETAADGGGTSNSNTTVSLGHLHSSQFSTFPLSAAIGHSQGFVDIFVDDFGPAVSALTKGSLVMTGTLSPTVGGQDNSDALVLYTIHDIDNGNADTNTIRMQFNTANPALDVSSGVLHTVVGDRLEVSYVFEIDAAQDNTAPFATAFADFSHTANFYVDTGAPGTDFRSQTGYDYATPLASNGVPEPQAWALLLAGFALTGAAVRRRRLRPA